VGALSKKKWKGELATKSHESVYEFCDYDCLRWVLQAVRKGEDGTVSAEMSRSRGIPSTREKKPRIKCHRPGIAEEAKRHITRNPKERERGMLNRKKQEAGIISKSWFIGPPLRLAPGQTVQKEWWD